MHQTYFVYKLTCRETGKSYIGVSNNPKRRLWEHRKCARLNPKFVIHHAMKKHGPDTFDLTVLYENSDKRYVYEEMEPFFINEYKTLVPQGYNMTTGGEGSPTLTTSEETRYKRSEAAKAQHADPVKKATHKAAMKEMSQRQEVRQQRSESANKRWSDPAFEAKMQVKYATPESQEKRSKAAARPCSEETKEKIRQSQIGKPRRPHTVEEKNRLQAAWTPEAKEKQRQIMLGTKRGSYHIDPTKPRKKFSEETLQRIRAAAQRRGELMKGRKLSEETKQKMSIAQSNRQKVANAIS
jgi:group I intron endonuclease